LAGGGAVGLDVDWTEEWLTEAFEVGRGITIPPGRYRFRQWLPAFSSNRSRALSGTLGYTGGQYYSGDIRGYSAGLRWRVGPNLALSGNYSVNDVNLPEGRFDTELARLRIDSSFSTRMFLNAFVQYTSSSRTWLTNVRFRFTYRPLSDFYIVYNDSRPSGRTPQQTVAIKHTLLLSF
jgi:hypothetical protein